MKNPQLFQQAKNEMYRAQHERNGIRPLYQKLVALEKKMRSDIAEVERLKKWAEIYMDENLKAW